MTAVLFLMPAFSISAGLFARDQKIEASAGPGGSIDPSGTVKVKRYSSITFTITPDEGYEILDVLVDDKSVGAVSSYRFLFVTKNHTIKASFIPKAYTIRARAGEGGDITPSGDVTVKRGDNQTFIIDADPGYEILNVDVDGESQGAISIYTFDNVSSNHTIDASFIRKTHTISASAGAEGGTHPREK